MRNLSRKEINERLEKLRESRHDDASYTITRPAMAMCYSMSPPFPFTAQRKCDNCGKTYSIEWSSFDKKNIEILEGIVKKFISVGLEGKLVCKCDKCVEKFDMNSFEIWLKSSDEDNWHISLPKHTSIFDYELVLKFLTVPDNTIDLAEFFDKLYNIDFRKSELAFFVGQEIIDKQIVLVNKERPWEERSEKESAVFENKNIFYSGKKPIDFNALKNISIMSALNKIKEHICYGNDRYDYIFNRFMSRFSENYVTLTYKGIYGDMFTHNFEDVGCIKAQIDGALENVLGLTITYDKLEEEKLRHAIDERCERW